jgi:hypothetical protein
MIIDVSMQAKNSRLPLKCVSVYSGSALPIAFVGMPARRAGADVVAVTVEIVNAAGMPISGSCFKRRGLWRCLMSAANFAVYGFVAKGLRVVLELATGEKETLAVGDFEVLAVDASAVKGEPSAMYVRKGGDVFLPSSVDEDGVQHYLKQAMAYDAEIGWGATWIGDYVLTAEGEYVEVGS